MSIKLTRRTLAKILGGSAAALSLPTMEAAAQAAAMQRSTMQGSAEPGARMFPNGFVWGSATAAYQVEGAYREGGRGMSIWDTFSRTPGKTANGDTGDVADDFYHRYPADITLMKNLGLRGSRFSVSWTRILPNGLGAVNEQGVDFYKRLVDTMRRDGLEPYCTLYHWDLPQVLQDRGGWENPDSPKWFAEYVDAFARRMGDRIGHYMTMNEMRTFVELGYGQGMHAPGLKVGQKRLAQLTHHVVLAHGMAVRALRAAAPAAKIGIADNVMATVPVIETPEHIQAARIAMREENAMFLTVLEEGRYTDLYLKRLGADAPQFTAEEMQIIASPMDFVGVNVYQPQWVRSSDNERGYDVVPFPASYPTMYSPWLKFGPEGLYWAPKLIHELWKVETMYITENGTSAEDVVTEDGHVYDPGRVMFLRNYLTQLQRGVSEGVPVKGYFLWSLLDNFEWADGYTKRFGIVYVDFATQKRTPKLSASFYAETVRRNSVA